MHIDVYSEMHIVRCIECDAYDEMYIIRCMEYEAYYELHALFFHTAIME